MQVLFSQILNMSLTASIIILFVIAARLLLRKAPKIYSYALWAVVLFRLLCPVSVASELSVLELTKPQVTQSSNVSIVYYTPVESALEDSGFSQVQKEPVSVKELQQRQADKTPTLMEIASYIWLTGMAVMLLTSVVSYLRLYRDLVGAMRLKNNIYLADHITSPFVLGTLFPKIYLPSDTPIEERRYIIAHERHHIRRCDHIVKLLAYAALCIHWFNPLVWAAFVLAGKDMEMSCDEAVIKKLGEHIRADYSASLLRLATHRTIIAGTPLAFGEGDTKGRVKNMAKWKKPKIWVSVLCVILCAVILIACAVNPEEKQDIAELTRKTNEGPTSCAYGELNYTLPGGITHEMREIEDYDEALKRVLRGEENRNLFYDVWSVDGVEIGGIQEHILPEGTSLDGLDWIHSLDLWELEDKNLGYFAGGSPYGVAEISFFTDVPPGTEVDPVDTQHCFFLSSDWTRVYDVWFDMLTVDKSVMNTILKSAVVGGPSPLPLEPEDALKADNLNILLVGRKADGETVLPDSTMLISMEPDSNTVTLATILHDTYVSLPDYQNHVTGNGKFISCYTLGYRWGGAAGGMEMVNQCLKDSFGVDVDYNIEITDEVFAELIGILGGIAVDVTETEAELLDLEPGTSIVNSHGVIAYARLEGEKDTTGAKRATREQKIMAAIAARMQYLSDAELQSVADLLTVQIVADEDAETASEAVNQFLNVFPSSTFEGCTIPYEGTYSQHQMELYGTLQTVLLVNEELTAPLETVDSEAEALAKCRAVLELVQSSEAYEIATERLNGLGALNATSTLTELGYGENRLWFDRIPESDGESTFGCLIADGVQYECDSQHIWKESSWYDMGDAWLASYQWKEENVTYMGTQIEDDKTIVKLRINEPYDEEDTDSSYSVNFRFGPDGSFLYLRVQNGGISKMESIVTLDAATVAAQISEEYFRATGKSLPVVTGSTLVTDLELYRKSFTSDDGTVTVNINTAFIPEQLEVEGGLSMDELMACVEADLRTTSVNSFGFDPIAMGYEGITCELNITEIRTGDSYLLSATEAVPTLEVWGERIYHFVKGDTMGQEQGAMRLLGINPQDGTILYAMGRKFEPYS